MVTDLLRLSLSNIHSRIIHCLEIKSLMIKKMWYLCWKKSSWHRVNYGFLRNPLNCCVHGGRICGLIISGSISCGIRNNEGFFKIIFTFLLPLIFFSFYYSTFQRSMYFADLRCIQKSKLLSDSGLLTSLKRKFIDSISRNLSYSNCVKT